MIKLFKQLIMKDFRNTAKWKKFSEQWPEGLTNVILICHVNNFGFLEDEYTVAYLDNVDGEVSVNVFGHTYYEYENEFQVDSLKEYVWDYLD